jgi:hypothetical protein
LEQLEKYLLHVDNRFSNFFHKVNKKGSAGYINNRCANGTVSLKEALQPSHSPKNIDLKKGLDHQKLKLKEKMQGR